MEITDFVQKKSETTTGSSTGSDPKISLGAEKR